MLDKFIQVVQVYTYSYSSCEPNRAKYYEARTQLIYQTSLKIKAQVSVHLGDQSNSKEPLPNQASNCSQIARLICSPI